MASIANKYLQDGLISFTDFKDFILRTSHEVNQEQSSSQSYVYMNGNGQKEGQYVLSAESISDLNGLFDEFKIKTA